jgi:hypothetical protein
MNKYFLKQQLAWVPFIGLACWALDMPLCAAIRAAILFVTRNAAVKMSKPPAVPAKNFARIQRLSSILWKARVLPKKKARDALALRQPVTAESGGYCHGVKRARFAVR